MTRKHTCRFNANNNPIQWNTVTAATIRRRSAHLPLPNPPLYELSYSTSKALYVLSTNPSMTETHTWQPLCMRCYRICNGLTRADGGQVITSFMTKLHRVPKKHVTTFSAITLTISVQLQKFLAQLVVSLCVIERWFHFPPHLSSATTLP